MHLPTSLLTKYAYIQQGVGNSTISVANPLRFKELRSMGETLIPTR